MTPHKTEASVSSRRRQPVPTPSSPARIARAGATKVIGLVVALTVGTTGLTALAASVSPAVAEVRRPAEAAGATALGSASYAAPSNAVYVSPAGSDSAAGTRSAPLRTVSKAVSLAPANGVVVLRGGQYNETVQVFKPLTIQNYPGETAWLDGTTKVSGWVKDGAAWRHDGWTTRFDHSPTYVKGAPDYTGDWRFVDTQKAPMAAYPDQVWVGGKRLQQVKSRSDVQTGSFYVDEATSKLYVGSDPTAGAVSASNLQYAINVRSAGVTLRGFGVRRYAPSVWQIAAVTLERPDATVENMVFSENATTGLSAMGSGVKINKVSVTDNGLLGIHGRFADNLSITNTYVARNNSERFNVGPVAGGVKLGASRHITVRDSQFADNLGHGFWEDMSNYDSVFSGNDFLRNDATGLFLEISAKAIVGDSLIMGNKLEGLKVNNTPDVKIWNNTIVDNARPVWLAQDLRRNTNPKDQAVDPRIPWPDPDMPWKLNNVSLANNVLGTPRYSANSLLDVEDYSYQDTAEQMHISTNGNVYTRETGSPSTLAIWSRGTNGAYVFSGLDSMKAKTGQEARGREYSGTDVVDTAGRLAASVGASAQQIALPMPADVAAALGRATGTTTLGAWTSGNATAAPTPTPTPTPTSTPTPTPTSPPATGGALAGDSFARTTASGWGSADRGGPWTVDVPEQFSVGGGVGSVRLRAGDGYNALLKGVSSTDADTHVDIAFDRALTGDGHFISLIGRQVAGGDYRLKVRAAGDGKVGAWLVRTTGRTETVLASTVTPVTPRSGGTISLRIQVSGSSPTSVRAKVWDSAGAEPSAFTLAATDSTTGLQGPGSVGLYAFASASMTNGPVTLLIDNFTSRTSG